MTRANNVNDHYRLSLSTGLQHTHEHDHWLASSPVSLYQNIIARISTGAGMGMRLGIDLSDRALGTLSCSIMSTATKINYTLM